MPADPDRPLLARLAGVAFRPVFITGDHRSGTTFLYSLLQATGRFNVVTAYHVLRYRELLTHHLAGTTERAKRELAEAFRAAGCADRGIDAVPLTPDMPEEYGFILSEGRRRPPRVTEANLSRFTELCRKAQMIGDPARPLLLKNPWDYDNSLFLKRHFPAAKFLFLARDPARTVNSQLRAGRTLLAARNGYLAMLSPEYGRLFRRPLLLALARALLSPRHGLAAALLARKHAHVVRAAMRERDQLPPADRFAVRYEDLCRSPNEAVAAILSWLGLPTDGLSDFRAMTAPRGGGLLPEVERLRPRLLARLRDYCAENGYTGGK